MATSWLKGHYLRRQGYYYCAVARGTSEDRADFPFKHKRVAEWLVLWRRRRTKAAWAVYRYGSRGAGEEYSDVIGIFSKTAPLAPSAVPADFLTIDVRSPAGPRSIGGSTRSRAEPAAASANASSARWRRRAAVAEAVAAERAKSLADMRATLALTQALLGVEPVEDARTAAPDEADDSEDASPEPLAPRPRPDWYERRG